MICSRPSVAGSNRCANHGGKREWYNAEWQKKSRTLRKKIPRCQLCGGPAEEVHHMLPRSAHSALIVLCKTCHRAQHA